MNENNLNDVESRISDFLFKIYGFHRQKTQGSAKELEPTQRKVIKSLFCKEHEVSGKKNVLNIDGSEYAFYGNLKKLIKYNSENYKKLVNIFKNSAEENKSWADDIVNFMQLNKNNIFPADSAGDEKTRYYIEKFTDRTSKYESMSKQEQIKNWFDGFGNGKNKFENYITIDYKSDFAIAEFLTELVRYRHEKNCKITSQDILKLSNFINDDTLLAKFKFDVAKLYKESQFDMKFIFDLGLDTGNTDSSGKFDDKRKDFIKFLDSIPEIGKLNFKPDELSDDQKYLIIISLVHDEFSKIQIDERGKLILDGFSFENLDLEKYKLSSETKKMISSYIQDYAKNYFDDKCGKRIEYLNGRRDYLNNQLEEYREYLSTSTKAEKYYTEDKSKISANLSVTQNEKKGLQKQVSSLEASQSKWKNVGILLACTVVLSPFSLACLIAYRKKENEINEVKAKMQKLDTRCNELKGKAESANIGYNKNREDRDRHIGEINKIKEDISVIDQELDSYNNFLAKLLECTNKDHEKENNIIPRKQNIIPRKQKEPIKIVKSQTKADNENKLNKNNEQKEK